MHPSIKSKRRCFSSSAILPVVRAAARVRDGDYEYFRGAHFIEEEIGKSLENVTANFAVDIVGLNACEGLRLPFEDLQGVRERVQELLA